MKKKLIIVGDSVWAEVAYEYFTHDSDYDVVAFSVERDFLQRESLFDLPVVPLEELGQKFAPNHHHAFVAVGYGQLNRLRARLYAHTKGMGYRMASYISSRASVWKNVQLGEHCFIFEDNHILPFVKIGDNVTMGDSNLISHHCIIGDHCFVSAHVALAGLVSVGAYSFLGLNATISSSVKVAADNWIGPGVTILKDTKPGDLFYPPIRQQPAEISTYEKFNVKKPT